MNKNEIRHRDKRQHFDGFKLVFKVFCVDIFEREEKRDDNNNNNKKNH